MAAALAWQPAPDPLAPPSAQFALTGSSFAPVADDIPSAAEVRPWGLRRAQPASCVRALPPWTYDITQQKAIDPRGIPLIDTPGMADPTALTTSSVDGEDPPSSEDWIND